MTKIENIPAKMRWEITAKSASAMPIVYDMVFRKALGSKFDELELPIWNEGGKEIKGIAKALGLPAQTAKEISETYGVITKILFGPELELKNVGKRMKSGMGFPHSYVKLTMLQT